MSWYPGSCNNDKSESVDVYVSCRQIAPKYKPCDACGAIHVNSVYFIWISITGYTSGTFEKLQMGQNPMSDSCSGRNTGIGVWLECKRFVWKCYKLPKTCHKQIDSLVDSYKCCTIERSCPRPLAGRLFHHLCLVGLAYRNRDPSSASWSYGRV